MPLEFAASVLARKSGRPVKITHTREEVFLTHRGRHPMHMKLKTGVKKDGSITALQFESLLDGGRLWLLWHCHTLLFGATSDRSLCHPCLPLQGTRVNTNKPPCGAQRGHGAVQPRFAFEVHLDRIAADLGIDPLDMRLKNAIESGMRTVNELRSLPADSGSAWSALRRRSLLDERRGRLRKGRGIGMAGGFYISGAGFPSISTPCTHSNVRIEVGPERQGHRLFRGFGYRPGLRHHACAGRRRNHRRSPGIR